jgi:hypothetical protein
MPPCAQRHAPRTASARSLSLGRLTAETIRVRSLSAVAPATVSTRQRRQPLDLLIVTAGNAANSAKRPVRLVRIDTVSRATFVLAVRWRRAIASITELTRRRRMRTKREHGERAGSGHRGLERIATDLGTDLGTKLYETGPQRCDVVSPARPKIAADLRI